jgi:hypothetical protein
MLGRTLSTEELKNDNWNHCLCGVAVSAVTTESNVFNREAHARWPWLREPVSIENLIKVQAGGFRIKFNWIGRDLVTQLCDQILRGEKTFEQVVDLIREIEPPEPEEKYQKPEYVGCDNNLLVPHESAVPAFL